MTLHERLARAFLTEYPDEAAQELERLPVQERTAMLAAAPALSVAAVERMLPVAAADAIAGLQADTAAALLERLPIHSTLAVLRRVPPDAATRLMETLSAPLRESLERVLRYPDGTAGALMEPRVFALPDDLMIGDARARLRRRAPGVMHYVYIVNRDGMLVGLLDLPQVLQGGARTPIRAAMEADVEHVPAWTPAAAIRTHPGWRRHHAMPVTDDAGRLVGVLGYETLRRLERDIDETRAARSTAETVGALGELFHLGMAGIVEGIAATARPHDTTPAGGGGER